MDLMGTQPPERGFTYCMSPPSFSLNLATYIGHPVLCLSCPDFNKLFYFLLYLLSVIMLHSWCVWLIIISHFIFARSNLSPQSFPGGLYLGCHCLSAPFMVAM